jgi:phage terminase small subunit
MARARQLTQKQRHFVQEYLVDLNATQAAIRAGYSERTAHVQGPRLLGNVRVQVAIQEALRQREKRTEITQDRVLTELAKIGFADIRDYLEYKTEKTVVAYGDDGEPIIDYRQIIDVIDSKNVDTSAIQEVSISKDGTFKFKLYDKQKALNDIGRHLGMFVDKTEVSGPDGGPIQWVDLVKLAKSDDEPDDEADS